MINTKQAARLRYLVSELVEAARADEMRGAQRPEDWQAIENDLEHARLALTGFVASITQPKATVPIPTNLDQARAMRLVAVDYMRRHRK